MDLDLLRRLSPSTRVLINRYPSRNFHRRLLEAGVANLVEVPPWQHFPLNTRGDWLAFIPEQSPMCHDAGVLVRAGGVSLLHCNDARLTVAQCRRAAVEAGGVLDVMAVQMSGASWHPIRYQYPPEVFARLSASKRLGKFKAVTRLVRDRKSTRLNSSHGSISYAVFCLKKKNKLTQSILQPKIKLQSSSE